MPFSTLSIVRYSTVCGSSILIELPVYRAGIVTGVLSFIFNLAALHTQH
jgi:hypothetical protein